MPEKEVERFMAQNDATNSVDKQKLKETGPGLYYRLEGTCNFHFGSEQILRLVEIPLRVAVDQVTYITSDFDTLTPISPSESDVATMTEALN